MQIESSSVDMMARKLCENVIKNGKMIGDEKNSWEITATLAEGLRQTASWIEEKIQTMKDDIEAHRRAAALIEEEIATMKNRMEKDNERN